MRFMETLTILDADWKNAEHCAAVVALIDAYAREPIEGGQPLSDAVRDCLAQRLSEHPTAFALLAYVDRVAAGVAICLMGFSTFAASPLINVHDLAVGEEFRGRGIGTALIEAVMDRARSSGCCKVTLEVRARNTAARRLYDRLGFQPAGGQATEFLERRC